MAIGDGEDFFFRHRIKNTHTTNNLTLYLREDCFLSCSLDTCLNEYGTIFLSE